MAARWPPPLPLLLLLLLPLLPPPAAPGTPAALPGRPRRAPRVGSAAAFWNHWQERNAEPHTESITFYRNQEELSTVGSQEGVMVQTSRMSQASSGAPETLTLLASTAHAGGRDEAGRPDFTFPPADHSPESESESAAALTSQGSALTSERLHLPLRSSGSEGRVAFTQMESGTSRGPLTRANGLPEVTVRTQVAATSVSSWSALPAVEPGEPTQLSRKRSPSGSELSLLQDSGTRVSSPPVYPDSSSGSTKELDNSTAFQSPSVSQTKRTQAATTFTGGVPRTLRSLTVSLEPIKETEDFTEDHKTATTSVSVHSSPSEVELRRNRATENPRDGESTEPSTENESGLTSFHWQNDSLTFRGRQLPRSSETGDGNSMPQNETMPGSLPSVRAVASTAHWFLTNSRTPADVTGTSASHPEITNTSDLTQFSDSDQQSRGGNNALHRSHLESSSSSSSESLDFSVRGGHSTLGDGDAAAAEESTPEARSGGAHTWATLTGAAERTLRSLTWPAGGAPRGNATEHLGLLAGSPGAGPALAVTGLSYGPVRGAEAEQRTSSDHPDPGHTYVSSAFTKGERTLLSITDSGSSSEISESSTSYVKTPDSSHSDSPSSPSAQKEIRNVSAYGGEYAQPATESLVLRTSNVPSYTASAGVPDTLVLLDADTASVGGSSLGPPLPVPSVSQSQPALSSSLPSTRAPVPKSTPVSSSPPLPASLVASTPALLSVSQTTFSHSSTTVLPGTRESPETSAETSTMVPSLVALHGGQTADPRNLSTPYQEKIITEARSPGLVSLATESTDAVTLSSLSGVPLSPALTESSTAPALLATSAGLVQTSPALTTIALKTPHPPVTRPSNPSSTALVTGPAAVHTTAGKQLLTHPETVVPQISTEGAFTTERHQEHVKAVTHLNPPTSEPATAKELTTRLGVTEEDNPALPFLRTSPPSQTTDVSTAEVSTPKATTSPTQDSTQSATAPSPPVSSCATSPCLHDGRCTEDVARGYRCTCSPSWQGDNCSEDVNECLSNPCPPLAMCNNTQGSYTCRCPVGYQLEKGVCNLVRTFVTEFKLKKTFLNTTTEKHSDLREIEKDITKTLNVCFSTLPGYIRSTVHASRESSTVVISLQTTFSLASNVTLFDLADVIQTCVNSCRSSAEVCQLLGSQRRIFRAGSLCKRKSPECDKETSICTDLDGVALCQCKSGYFQFNKMDHSCRACEDGYRLENETCMSCPFGLGGLNCGNPYQLVTVVIAAAGGGLLLILGTALIVTCCRKSKNDISKLIFKSGDFQMSPYAEYPKNPRSQEWGREAIEMHENGSTKNLLQMTDTYYTPANVRNPELERNGLYPAYTGLPGSRHSCIFPGQYNPSFVSDESRRRDYF